MIYNVLVSGEQLSASVIHIHIYILQKLYFIFLKKFWVQSKSEQNTEFPKALSLYTQSHFHQHSIPV